MFTFATDYYLCVLIAAIGVLQIAFSIGQIRGLLIFKSPIMARGGGLTLAVLAFIWFFSTGDRNINDYEGGLDANVQALFFFYGAFSAVIVTFVVASIVNYRMEGQRETHDAGLDAVRDTNYAKALAHSLSYWGKNWRTLTKTYFSG